MKPESVLTAMQRVPIDRSTIVRVMLFSLSAFGILWAISMWLITGIANIYYGGGVYGSNGHDMFGPLLVAYTLMFSSAWARGKGSVVLSTFVFNVLAMIMFIFGLGGAGLYYAYISPPFWDCILDNTLTNTEFLICNEHNWVRQSVYWPSMATVIFAIVSFFLLGYDAIRIFSRRIKSAAREPTTL